MVHLRRSLLSSVTREDEFSSPLSTIRPAQFSCLQSGLRNWKTIISLTTTCHSISVFLANDWKIELRGGDENLEKKTDLLSNQFDKFSDQSATVLIKVRENSTHGVSRILVISGQAWTFILSSIL